MTDHPRYALRTVVLVLLLGVVVGLFVADLSAAKNPLRRSITEKDYEAFTFFTEVYHKLVQYYVGDVDRLKLAREAVQGMLQGLDPYCVYIGADELKHFQDATQGKYEGLGIRIVIMEGRLTVESPMEGGPAFRAGVLPGDRIEKIEGEPTAGIKLIDAVNKLKGPAGSSVIITVRHRASGETEDITIVRAQIEVPSTAGVAKKADGTWHYWADRDARIAYVRLTAFQETSAAELRDVLEALAKQRMRGLILDLRFNPGGLLKTAVMVSDMFVSKGVIVSTRGRAMAEEVYKARASGTFADFPLMVLVNEWSASASEIVAGAVQDHKRGRLVGSRTFGKGSVQKVFDLDESDQGAIKLTVAAYYTPNGRSLYNPTGSVHDGNGRHLPSGLEPDIVVPISPADEVRLRKHWAAVAGVGIPESKPSATQPAATQPTPFVDVQLGKALDALREELQAPATRKATSS